MIESKLSHHLLSLCPADAQRATVEHDFIAAVGKGTIAPARLQAWLAQDRIYLLLGYLPLLGSMLTRVPLPVASGAGGLGPGSEESKRYMRTVTLLGDAVQMAIRETALFEKTAREVGFDLSVGALRTQVTSSPSTSMSASTLSEVMESVQSTPPLPPISEETSAYLNYMSRIAHTGSWLEQLTLLWAMEILYYRAWSQAASYRARSAHASSSSTSNPSPTSTSTSTSPSSSANAGSSPSESGPSLSAAQDAAISALVHNWSSADFATFVEELGDLLDYYGGQGDIVALDRGELARVQAVWRTTVWHEARFWDAGAGGGPP